MVALLRPHCLPDDPPQLLALALVEAVETAARTGDRVTHGALLARAQAVPALPALLRDLQREGKNRLPGNLAGAAWEGKASHGCILDARTACLAPVRFPRWRRPGWTPRSPTAGR